ncbi:MULTISPECIES: zinc metallopeptidase [unclassified Oleiphilus]|jgi:Zn-dependent membrane protease YugP|uniref:zinc metallopeptidase n=2 Tax=Oleiphilus TaxID=141450 RepID=UPI0007C228C3|nr:MULTISPECIES: zinc metallopeptidase [unclassified Oleiphilus]KZY44526.1 Zn-dependent protease [Oleiphilus sp. HI0050]KZY81277.1 Zn-dependent protease [Oleiphilus sp. HI0069]KZY81883.1 Zn-dependent protease [Oleiphilus sp. HI0068]KZY85941.1 Zn-dependent protease [Oleiphilus sp. HI0072]KZZ11315.1 Zn-dependent protease [Oleiphilus sp. HI0078]KZZ25469.1 Zn-dependent protease [Oleiphilus sp. HI0081]KZZ44523.1 Zn-dependent protease [Oleiphilus sp. HI0085]
MIYILIALILFVLITPGIWVKYTIKKYAQDLPDIPGTGAELVKHLSKRFELVDLKVEECPDGQDHFSPHESTIRLSKYIYDGRSISAVAIACHEFGHALQYHRNEKIVRLRERYTPIALLIEKAAIAMLGIIPVLVVIFKVPQLGIISLLCGLCAVFISVALQLVILPMEWDASFNKALPIITEGNYLQDDQIEPCRKILKAAAMTYVAATLASVLNVWRWLAILRR